MHKPLLDAVRAAEKVEVAGAGAAARKVAEAKAAEEAAAKAEAAVREEAARVAKAWVLKKELMLAASLTTAKRLAPPPHPRSMPPKSPPSRSPPRAPPPRAWEVYLAAEMGDAKRLASLVSTSQDAAFELRDPESGATPLIAASARGHEAAVRILLDDGRSRVDGTASDGDTALLVAAYGGHAQVVHLLLAAGADVEMADERGYTALIAATYYVSAPRPRACYLPTSRLLLCCRLAHNTLSIDCPPSLARLCTAPRLHSPHPCSRHPAMSSCVQSPVYSRRANFPDA